MCSINVGKPARTVLSVKERHIMKARAWSPLWSALVRSDPKNRYKPNPIVRNIEILRANLKIQPGTSVYTKAVEEAEEGDYDAYERYVQTCLPIV
jgi:hypothetical protein